MKISVIVPAYNEEEHIRDCLDSLLNQSRNLDEIIVIDDKSTDRTPEILDEYKDLEKITILENEENIGVGKTIMKGFKESSYEIISVLDADSEAPDDWLKKIENKFSKNKDLGCAGGHVKVISENNSFLGKFLAENEIDTGCKINPAGSGIAFSQKAISELKLDEDLPDFGWDSYAPKVISRSKFKTKKFNDIFVYIYEKYTLSGLLERMFRYGKGTQWISHLLDNRINKKKLLLHTSIVLSPVVLALLLWKLPTVGLFSILALFIYSYYRKIKEKQKPLRILFNPFLRYVWALGGIAAILSLKNSNNEENNESE